MITGGAKTQGDNPELGQFIDVGGVATNVHDRGSGFPLVLLHGSGPGVSAWANWRLNLPILSQRRRVIAPDLPGFGYTQRPADNHYDIERWLAHLSDLLHTMKLPQVDLVGNSFGGALALAFAIRHPHRVRRLVLMGAAGVRFELTPGLDAVWGYQPSIESMRKLLDIFAWDRSLVTDELAELRYRASIRPQVQESFASMFPAPRQRWVDMLASDEQAIRNLPHPALILHGREDGVIPLQSSLKLAQWIPRSQLHVFGQCGHWTQIEHATRFNQLVEQFVTEADETARVEA